MSKDAQHDSQGNLEQAGAETSSTIEVLLRLPDVRKLQPSSARPTESSTSLNKKSDSSNQKPGSPHVMGPILDSVRRHWSTWKNAAMFAQVGITTRFLVVGGLVLGMVVAAYLLMDRKGTDQDLEIERNNTAQDVSPGPQPQVAAPSMDVLPPSPLADAKAPVPAAAARQAPIARAPRARLELESNEFETTSTQPAIQVINSQQRNIPVYSADARYGDTRPPAREYPDDRFQTRAAQNGDPAKFGRSSESRQPGYGSENRQADPSYQPQRDPYAPVDRQQFRDESRFGPNTNRTRQNGAGFRGTIEPAPYRNP